MNLGIHEGSGVTVASKACIAFGFGCCPRVRVDTVQLFEFFRLNGWELCDSIEEADLVVVTSCGFCVTQCLAILCVLPFNFIVNKLWSFREA